MSVHVTSPGAMFAQKTVSTSVLVTVVATLNALDITSTKMTIVHVEKTRVNTVIK